jgi:NDP-sugar pyrophosphorylase family protein
MRILILAAGVGSRLRPLTEAIPKPLLPLGETNILERLLSQLRFYFDDIQVYVNCAFLPEKITSFISRQPIRNRAKVIWESEPLGTAVTTLDLFRSDPSQGLLVIHGDLVVSNHALPGILHLTRKQTKSFIMVHERPLNQARSILTVQNSEVIGIKEIDTNEYKTSTDTQNVLVNSGVLFFAPNSLNDIEMPKKGTDISPYLVQELSKLGNLSFDHWKWRRVAVDSLSSYEEAINLAASESSLNG